MAYDREAARKQLEARQKERTEKAGASGFIGVLKDGLPMWKVGEGKHKFDMLPYIVGKKHPTADKGKYDYMLDVFLHQNVGVDNAQYICLKEMFGKDCPICDYRSQLQQDGEDDKDKLKKLKAKHFGLYNIICRDSSEQENKGVQLLFINTWNMEDRLRELSDSDSGEPILYPNVEEGKTISFKRTGMGKDNTRYTAHAFLEREKKISEKILDKTFTLDECIVIPTEAEVEKAFFGGLKKKEKEVVDDDDDDADIKSKDNKKPSNKVPSEDDIEEMTRKELKNLIEDLSLDIDPDDDKFEEKDDLRKAVIKAVKLLDKKKDDDDKDVPEEKGKEIPSKDDIEDMSRKELKAIIKEHDLDIDPDDDDYEEKEDLRKAVLKAFGLTKDKKKEKAKEKDEETEEKEDKKSDGKEPKCCVKKGTFGVDFDKFTECLDECPNFDACSDAFDALKKDKKKINRR